MSGENGQVLHMTAKRFRRGLVVGKFCPLHLGHMHLIAAAIGHCDEVLVISYTKPGFPRCNRAAREDWIARLFPDVAKLVIDDASLAQRCRERGITPPMALPLNDAPDEVHREFTAWLCWALCSTTVDAVFTSEDYGDGFAQALSRHFSAWSGALKRVVHVCVDRARLAVPVSGTAVRADPYSQRHHLDRRVYADLVDRVCILGGESSGKTTLVHALARALGTSCVPELGRMRWEEKGGRLDYGDMLEIARDQLALETTLAEEARRWIICDGSALTSVFYSEAGYGKVDPELRRLGMRRYAATFVCAPDFPFVQDGTRRDAAFRERQHAWYLAALDAMGVEFIVLEGPVDVRIGQACRVLGAKAI